MSFDFANAALTPAAWHIDFDASGAGHYHSQPGNASSAEAHGVSAEPYDQEIAVSPALRGQLFEAARSRKFFNMRCESPQHKVAFTGQKTVSYRGEEGQGSCTFNWSPDARLMRLAESFIAMAYTLEEGRRLRLEYLHDRLSLDAELETLTVAAKSGNALEFQNIAPDLKSIAEDPAVMKRAQARAAALLAIAP